MVVTIDELRQKAIENQIPLDAIFDSDIPKKLVWGGYHILNTLYDNKLNWIREEVRWKNREEYQKICKRLGEEGNIQAFCIMVYGSSGGVTVYDMLANDDFKNTLELSGGLENYLKMEV